MVAQGKPVMNEIPRGRRKPVFNSGIQFLDEAMMRKTDDLLKMFSSAFRRHVSLATVMNYVWCIVCGELCAVNCGRLWMDA